MNQKRRSGAGFTLIELLAVIIILSVLAGVALPRFFSYQQQAQVASVKGTLGGVRAGIANFYANAAIGGSAAYPSLTELTDGSVMQEDIPDNPYRNTNDVASANATDASNRTVAGTAGWRYYTDTTTTATFYCNSTDNGSNTF